MSKMHNYFINKPSKIAKCWELFAPSALNLRCCNLKLVIWHQKVTKVSPKFHFEPHLIKISGYNKWNVGVTFLCLTNICNALECV